MTGAEKDNDWVRFLEGPDRKNKKQILIDECMKHGVSVYISDPSESSSGTYAAIRAIASETELEQRLNAKIALIKSGKSNVIALCALVVSIASIVIALVTTC